MTNSVMNQEDFKIEVTPSLGLEIAIEARKTQCPFGGGIRMSDIGEVIDNIDVGNVGEEESLKCYGVLVREYGENDARTKRFGERVLQTGIKLDYLGERN